MREEAGSAPRAWSAAEHKRFEAALSRSAHEFGAAEPNWEEFQRMHGLGRQGWELKRQFEMLVRDVADIEAGLVGLPNYGDISASSAARCDEDRGGNPASPVGPKKQAPPMRSCEQPQERRKGIPWSEEEHKQFLRGLDKYGKGDWRSISRHFVISRTPTQVASHAQKYFLRLTSRHKDKRRNSIHDITSATPALRSSNASRPLQQQSNAYHNGYL